MFVAQCVFPVGVFMTSVIFDVDLASAFKNLILSNDNVVFSSAGLKDKIISTNDNDLLMVKRSIGSNITILAVDDVNDALLKKYL